MNSEWNLNNTAVPCDKENRERWQQARLSVETTYADAPVVKWSFLQTGRPCCMSIRSKAEPTVRTR